MGVMVVEQGVVGEGVGDVSDGQDLQPVFCGEVAAGLFGPAGADEGGEGVDEVLLAVGELDLEEGVLG